MAGVYRKPVLAQQSDLPAPPALYSRGPASPRERSGNWISGTHIWIKASLPEESPCLLTGVCILGDSLIVCDNENKTLKRFHIDGRFLEEVFLTDPCGICKLPNSNDVAITEPEINQITVCCLDAAIVVTFSLSTKKKYQSIAALDDKYVVGCCDVASPCIDFIDSNGTILYSLKSKNETLTLFKNPASVTCLSSDNILISDPGSCAVICATPLGDQRFKLETQGRPSGICVDESGSIYMAHYDSNIVYRLTNEGKIETVAVDQRYHLRSPLAACVSNGILAITEETPSDRILLIKLTDVLEKQSTCVSLSGLQFQ
ncbi:uncharacterized protein LOC127855539 [Dreissena polymorpha]|uniref:Uncharacterized protein n=1 Tax=Dreissena polymorpha TaxID=45954 RepID=A0A9D4N884_DREPO|nr:uncharacterized protein LOC127855539 [Dreissena polymorpha]XP_052247234.1 uncharacterized protein LOC127855539 [Dreissena polymorpha]XP_052247240.1 uncharacterized protein LOC127855539 [Dreissena polymorpha]XP_052247248.1 uncharacterized protein LOC127855539 [Dreissena polymorpha]KAH3891577.1 hypothetical protein DPMN_015681 [Dreissena polymorpha]